MFIADYSILWLKFRMLIMHENNEMKLKPKM